MPDYQKAKVYRLIFDGEDELDDCYIGSTCLPLSVRIGAHRRDARSGRLTCVHSWMRDVGFDNVKIVLLEEVPCNSFEEQRRHEQRFIDELKPSLNSKHAYTTREERIRQKREADRRDYEKHREQRLEYAKEYAANNKDAIRERSRAYRQNNAEIVKARKAKYYRENHQRITEERERQRRDAGIVPRVRYNTDEERHAARLQKYKRYHAKHKSSIALREAVNRDINRESVLKKEAAYRAANRDKINERQRAYRARKRAEKEAVAIADLSMAE